MSLYTHQNILRLQADSQQTCSSPKAVSQCLPVCPALSRHGLHGLLASSETWDEGHWGEWVGRGRSCHTKKLAHLLDWLIRLVTCVMRWRILFIRNSPLELLSRKSVHACPVVPPSPLPSLGNCLELSGHVYPKGIFMDTHSTRTPWD